MTREEVLAIRDLETKTHIRYGLDEHITHMQAIRTAVPALCDKVLQLMDENALLRAENEEWRQINDSTGFEYEKLRAELEAAKQQLSGHCWACAKAKPAEMGPREALWTCEHLTMAGMVACCPHWEWRGPCTENGGTK